MGKHWTPKETDTLREMYQTSHIDVICDTLNKTRHQVYQRAKKIGLKRPNEWRVKMCPIPRCEKTQFKKGHQAWNKGKKLGSGYGGVDTQFKKGQVPHNKLPEELKEVTKQLSRLKKNLKQRQRYAQRQNTRPSTPSI